MGLFDWIFRRSTKSEAATPARFDLAELSRRVGLSADALRSLPIKYHEFQIPKRSGGMRTIQSPDDQLKNVQRLILHRVLGRLRAHECAHGFEAGRSIVTNALPHANSAVILKLDIRNFFPATTTDRVRAYFLKIGWDTAAADALTRICTHKGGLPQGAPTSPRLSNLVNFAMDARLAAAARGFRRVGINPKTLEPVLNERTILEMVYTRYADDITFSFAEDGREVIHTMIRITKKVLSDYGYELHQRTKLQIRRRHERQMITGLVVNEHAQLPRETRRRLRAMRHRMANNREITISAEQFAGWEALEHMIESQSAGES